MTRLAVLSVLTFTANALIVAWVLMLVCGMAPISFVQALVTSVIVGLVRRLFVG